MATVAIKRPVLEWARRRSGHDATTMRQQFRRWDHWLTGRERPTFAQAQQLSEFTHVPFGLLLASEPPVEPLPIPDFRAGRGEAVPPSDDLLETLYLNQRRQAWYEEYVTGFGAEPLAFVGAARDASPTEAAASMRAALDYEIGTRHRLTSIDAARKHLIAAFESLGGLVVVTSMVGNNTHRMLDLEEFRGFTLHSEVAPLVFVNAHDTKRGQVFSLLHEFAHVWRGESGVSDGGEPLVAGRGAVERWCDHVAAEVAVPLADLKTRFRALGDLTEELDRLANFYRCSTLVVLLRLREAGLVERAGFGALYDAEVSRLVGLLEGRKQTSGGTFYNNQPFRIGETLSRALIRDTQRGRTPLPEALSLMSFKSAPRFDRYAQLLGEAWCFFSPARVLGDGGLLPRG